MFVPGAAFERQVARLRRVVPLGQSGLSITFDDAYVSFLDAFAVLERRRLPVTLFVPSGKLGGVNDWDAGSSCDRRLMSAAQVAELARRGAEIASHGHMHLDLTAASTDEVRADLSASMEALAEMTGRRPRFLAYPWGRHDARVRALAAEAGFEAAYAVGVASGDRFGLERVQVEPRDGRLRFTLKASGTYGVLRRYRRTLTSTKSASSTRT